jgi:NADPH:quinone reductase-like Zn-dependent oxidoreductase
MSAIRPGPKAIFGIVESTSDDLKWVASKLANSKLKPTPIRTFSLSKSADAHRAFEREKLRGEIIIQVRQEAKAPRRLPNISSPLERVASA